MKEFAMMKNVVKDHNLYSRQIVQVFDAERTKRWNKTSE